MMGIHFIMERIIKNDCLGVLHSVAVQESLYNHTRQFIQLDLGELSFLFSYFIS